MPGNETIGQRLQRMRRDAGFSQSQLAAAAEVPLGTIRNWEQDRRSPQFDTVIRIAKVLGVSLDGLAGNAEPEPAKPRGRGKGK